MSTSTPSWLLLRCRPLSARMSRSVRGPIIARGREAGDSAEVGVKIGARHRSSIANANRRHVAGSAVSGENILRMTGFPGVGFPPPDLAARSVEFMASAAV